MYILEILKKEKKNREPNMAKTKSGKLSAGICPATKSAVQVLSRVTEKHALATLIFQI